MDGTGRDGTSKVLQEVLADLIISMVRKPFALKFPSWSGAVYIAYIPLKAYSANNDHQCTHPTYTLPVSRVAMKAVILSGTPRSRSGITEYHEVDRPCAKADQVIGMINLIDDGVEGGY